MLGYALNGSSPADLVVTFGAILLDGYVLQFAFAVRFKLPLINQNSILDVGSMKSRRSYVTGAADLIKAGFAQVFPFITHLN